MSNSDKSSSTESEKLIFELPALSFSSQKRLAALRLKLASVTVISAVCFTIVYRYTFHGARLAKTPNAAEFAIPSDDLAEIAVLWKQLWTADPRAREVFAKARAAFPKPGQPFHMMPWPELHQRGANLSVVMRRRPGGARRLGRARDISNLDGFSPETVLGLDAVLPANPVVVETSPSANQANQVQTTECFFDAYQGLQYFAYGGLSVYYSATSTGPFGLSESILSVVSCAAWIGSYLAAAASDCLIGQPMNFRANCASDVIWFIGNFPQLAADAMYTSEDCKPQKKVVVNETRSLQAKVKLEAAKNKLDKLRQIVNADPQHKKSQFQRRLKVIRSPPHADRAVGIASCFFDTQAAISFFARFGIEIQLNIGDCDKLQSEVDKQNCAWSIIYGIDNLGWAMEYLMQIATDCPAMYSGNAACAEDIADLVFTGTSFAPAGGWMASGCTHLDGYG